MSFVIGFALGGIVFFAAGVVWTLRWSDFQYCALCAKALDVTPVDRTPIGYQSEL